MSALQAAPPRNTRFGYLRHFRYGRPNGGTAESYKSGSSRNSGEDRESDGLGSSRRDAI